MVKEKHNATVGFILVASGLGPFFFRFLSRVVFYWERDAVLQQA